MKARYESECPVCGDRISAGDEITRAPYSGGDTWSGAWIHAGCLPTLEGQHAHDIAEFGDWRAQDLREAALNEEQAQSAMAYCDQVEARKLERKRELARARSQAFLRSVK